MNPLFSYTIAHKSYFHLLFLFFRKKKQQLNVVSPTNTKNESSPAIVITMATITPAQTTTQLLISNTQSCSSTFILPQKIIDLSMILQNSCKIPVSSSSTTGVGHLQPLDKNIASLADKHNPPAAQQTKRPAWTDYHAYLRGSRTNSDNLRILATEINMIRASKITRSLRPRRPYLSRREDEFVWGNPTSLRISQTNP